MSKVPWRPPTLVARTGLPVSLTLFGRDPVQAAEVCWTPSYRIIASEYAGENLFDRIASADEFEDFRALADLTSPHSMAEAGELELVPVEDRIWGEGTGLIMAAFAWPGRPSRFSDGARGTYYAARLEETAVDETVYHDEQFLVGSGPVVLEKTLIEAELGGTLVDVRGGRPAPPRVYDPIEYADGQSLGTLVRDLGGDGIVYDSVRHRHPDGSPAGECAVVFRPPVLRNAVAARTIEYHWDGRRISHVRR